MAEGTGVEPVQEWLPGFGLNGGEIGTRTLKAFSAAALAMLSLTD